MKRHLRINAILPEAANTLKNNSGDQTLVRHTGKTHLQVSSRKLTALALLMLISPLWFSVAVGQTYTSYSSGSYTVPPGVTSVTISAVGGRGGSGGQDCGNGCGYNPGAYGGYTATTVSVTPGGTISFTVGSDGGNGASDVSGWGGGNGGSGYYSGGSGGNAGSSGRSGAGGGGGGATGVVYNGSLVLVAGGGGGGGGHCNTAGSGTAGSTSTGGSGSSNGGSGSGSGGSDGGGGGGGGGGWSGGGGGGLYGLNGEYAGYGGNSGSSSPSGSTSSSSPYVQISYTAVGGTASASASTICSGNSTTITLSGYAGSIQWQVSSDNSYFSNISGATSASVSTGALSSSRWYRALVSGAVYSTTASVQVSTGPAAPSSLSGYGLSVNSVSISWGASGGSPAPTYYWVLGGQSGSTTGTSVTVGSLSSNSSYSFTVYASNSCGTSSTSTSGTFKTYPDAPSISATTPVCIGNATTLTATGIQGTVYWYNSSNTLLGTGTPFNVYPVTGGTTYYYYAKNYNGAYYSAATGNVAVITKSPATVPSSATCTGTTESTAALSWGTSTATDAITYHWVVGTTPSVTEGNGVIQGTTSDPTKIANPTGLTPSTTYYLRVYATTAATCGNSSYQTSAAFVTVPLAPVAATQTLVRANSFTANWAASTGATKYYLDVATNPAFTGYYVTGYQNRDVGNVLTLPISGLNRYTHYYYRVRAYNAGGNSVNSNVIDFTTLPLNSFLIEKVGGGSIGVQMAGQPFSIKITARDAQNTTITDYTGSSAVAISTNSTLTSGGLTANFVAGILTSHSVTLTKSGDNMTLTATKNDNGINVTSTSNTFTVTSAALDHFTLAVDGTITAGTAFTVTATAYDSFNNVKTNYGGASNVLDYTGTNNVNWTTTATSSPNGTARIIPANGVQNFVNGVSSGITGFTFYNSAESPIITITDATTAKIGTTAAIVVNHAPLDNFKVESLDNGTHQPGTNQISGAWFDVRVTARDVYWNTATTYAGNVRFKSSADALVTFPAGLQSFVGANGIKTFSNTSGVKIDVNGAYWVRVADQTNPGIIGDQQNIIIGPGSFSPLSGKSTMTISDPSTPAAFVDPLARIAGEYVFVTITPRDAQGNLLYSCQDISVYLYDGAAAGYGGPFVVNNIGDGTYTATVRVTRTGANTIRAKLGADFMDQIRTVNVAPAPVDLAHTLITADKTTMQTNETSLVTVQLKDAFDNNRVTDDGTLSLTTLPTALGILDNTTILAKTLNATYNGAGSYVATLKINEHGLGTSTISGTLNGSAITDNAQVIITDGPATHLAVSGSATQTAGASQTITVTALDNFDNTATSYIGSHSLTYSGATASPGPITTPTTAGTGFGTGTSMTFSAGVASAPMALYKVETAVVHTADGGGLNSTGYDLSVAVGHATYRLVVTTPPSTTATAGVAFTQQPVVVINDQYGNQADNDNTTTVTAARAVGTAILQGTTTVTVTGGTATFANLSYNKAEAITVGFSSSPAYTVPATSPVNVGPATAAYFAVTGTGTQTAGTSQNITVTAYDQYGNVATGYTGSHTLTFGGANSSTDPVVSPTIAATNVGTGVSLSFTAGVTTATMFLFNAETASIAVTDGTINATGHNLSVLVNPAAANKLAMNQQPSTTAIAGVAFVQQPKVNVEDQYGNLRSADNATTVTVAAVNGGAVTLGGTLTVTVSGGVATFTGLNFTYATTIHLNFTSSPSYTAVASGDIVVSPNVTDHYHLNDVVNIVAGTRAAYTVTRHDIYNNPTVAGTETVYLTSTSDGAAKGFFTVATGGTGVTSITIPAGNSTSDFWYYDEKIGNWSITASDHSPADGNTGIKDVSDALTVLHAPVDHFTINAPADFAAGSDRAAYTVGRQDVFNNPVTTGSQVVYLYSSSTGVNKKFYSTYAGNGVITQVTIAGGASTANFWYYDEKTGDHTITVSDHTPAADGDTGIKDATDQLTITPGLLKNFMVYGVQDPHDLGTWQSFTVEARDFFNNRKTDYDGTVTFSNTDAGATNPADHKFELTDLGIHQFDGTHGTGQVKFSQPGNWWLYAIDLDEPGKNGYQADITVQRAVTITANDRSKTYGDALAIGNTGYTVTGIVAGVDPVPGEITGVTLTCPQAASLTAHAGTYAITPSLATGTFNPLFYHIVYTDGTLTVDKRPITLTAASNTKQYDGTTTAVTLPAFTSGSLAAGDVGVYSESYDNKNQGSGKTLTPVVTSIKDAGNADVSDNYIVTTNTSTNGTINRRPITLTATTNTKIYDGDLTAAAVPTLTSGSLATGDAAVYSETYDNKNQGTGKTMTPVVTSMVDGSSVDMSDNYTVTVATSANGVINRRPITLTASANTKLYDGDLTATALPTLTSGTLASGDVAIYSETYNTKNQGTGKTMTPAVTSIVDGSSGDMSGNYVVTLTTRANGIINKRPITLTGTTNTKTYDGDLSAAAIPALSSGSLATGDAGIYSEIYDTKNQGTGKNMIPSITSIKDAGNVDMTGNYDVTLTNSANGIINRRPISVTASANTKTYDGDLTSATVPTLTSGTLATGDAGVYIETYDTKNQGSGKTMTPMVISLKDAGLTDMADNYDVTLHTSANGVINRRLITLTGSANTKTYDGLLTAAAIPSLTGSLATGDVGVYSETYDTKNQGTGKTMTPAVVSLVDGSSVDMLDNYTVTLTPGANGIINKRLITVTSTTNTKTYDGLLTAAALPTVTSGTLATGDVGTYVETYDTKNQGTGKTMTPAVVSIVDGLAANMAGNYTVTLTNSTDGVIETRPITLTGSTNTKTYDGLVTASAIPTITSGTLAAGDAGIYAETYDTKNQGTGKTMLPSVVSIKDAGNVNMAGNYDVTLTNSANGIIQKRQITIAANANTKTYDGDRTATTASTLTVGTLAAGDVGTYTETYDTKDWGTGKTMTPAVSIVDGGSPALVMTDNYDVTLNTSANGIINKKVLTVDGISASDKTYDGATTATLVTGGYALHTVIGAETVTLDVTGYTANFDDKSYGINRPVVVSGLALGGVDGGNYNLTQPMGLSANINKRLVTLTAAANTKVYDGGITAATSPTLTSGTLATGDVGLYNETYDNKNQGTGKTMTPVVTSLVDGTSVDMTGNYTITLTNSANGVITTLPLTITANNLNKCVGSVMSYAGTEFTTSAMAATEGIASVTLTSAGSASGAVANTYDLVPTVAVAVAGTDLANYSITYVKGNLVVNPPTVGGLVTGGSSICPGSTSNLLTLSGHTGSVVKWQSSVSPFTSWTDIANTTTTYTTVILTENTQVRAVVRSGACAIVNSAATTITVNGVSNGGTVTGGTTICSGSTSGSLTLTGQQGNVTKWQSSTDGFATSTDIPYTSPSYTSGILTQTTQFRAVVQNAGCTPANSIATTVTVVPASVGGTLSPASLTAIQLGQATGTMTLSGQTGTITKWQERLGSESWIDLDNTASTMVEYPNVAGTWEFRAVVQSGTCWVSYSSSSSVVVNPSAAGAVTGGSSPICLGVATGTMTLANYTGSIVKWQKNVDSGVWSDIANATATYSETPASEGTWRYRAVISNGSTLYSAPTRIVVSPIAVGGTISGSSTICSGNTSGLLSLSGQTGTIQKWQSSVAPFTSWTDIANTASTYVSGALNQTTHFRVVVQSGSCGLANSDEAIVTVNTVPVPTITGSASVLMAANVQVYSTEAGMTAYQWNVSSGGTITSGGTTTDATATVTWNTTGSQSVSVNYTNASGCSANTATVKSVTVSLVAPPPPPPPFVRAAQTITFTTLPEKTCGDADYLLAATSSSKLKVTYVSSDTKVAVILNGCIHFVGAGTCNITASQIGNDSYAPATDVVRVLVVKIKPITGDTNGDGQITPPEIAGDTNGDGKITAPEIAGDVNGDGKITAPEIAGDTNGDGIIDGTEIAGDTNGDGKITAPEIAGDTNGDGIIDGTEIAGDTNGDGKITAPEIAGDTNGDGKIDGTEIAGDTNGDGKIDGTEIAGDTNGDGIITPPEIAGDTNGDGKIDGTEIAGDTNGDGKIDGTEVTGDTNGDGKIDGTEVFGDKTGDGTKDVPYIAGDTNGDGKITAPEIAGDTNGDGKIDGTEIAGDTNGDGKITAPEIAGDTNGDGKIDGSEIAGDTNGDGIIDGTEIAGDTNGDGRIDGSEVAGDTNGNGIIDGTEIAGDTNGDGKITGSEIMGDTNGDGKITGSEIAGDANGDGKITGTEVAGDPMVILNSISNKILCSGSSSAQVTFTVANTGGNAIYAWTNSTAAIGLAASGTGNLPAFTATNTGATPVVATITVIPTFTVGGVSHIGQAKGFTITVNPTPAAIAGADRIICPGISATLGASAIVGNTYSWSSQPAGFTSALASPIVTPIVSTSYILTETTTSTGCSSSHSVMVSVKSVPKPTVTGLATVCAGTNNVAYATEAGLTGYQWTLPSGANIVSGNGTNNIVVNYSNNATSGNILASGVTDCGTTVVSASYPVTVNPIPQTPVISASGTDITSSSAFGNQWYFTATENGSTAALSGANSQYYTPTQDGWYQTQVTASGCVSAVSNLLHRLTPGEANQYNVYPVPNHGAFTIKITTPNEQVFTILIFDQLGHKLYEVQSLIINGEFDQAVNLLPASTGIYTIMIKSKEGSVIKKFNINK